MAAFPEQIRAWMPWGCWKHIERYLAVPSGGTENSQPRRLEKARRDRRDEGAYNLFQNTVIELLLPPIGGGLDERQYEGVRIVGLGTELRLKQRGYKET